jgi:hypothetical protein
MRVASSGRETVSPPVIRNEVATSRISGAKSFAV